LTAHKSNAEQARNKHLTEMETSTRLKQEIQSLNSEVNTARGMLVQQKNSNQLLRERL